MGLSLGNAFRYWLQFKTLVKKDFKLAIRNKTWLCLISPIILILLLFFLNFAFKSGDNNKEKQLRYPPVEPMDPLSSFHCTDYNVDCTMVAYAPTSPTTDKLMARLERLNGVSIKGYDTEDDLLASKIETPKAMFAAIIFSGANIEPNGTIAYKIYYDSDTTSGSSIDSATPDVYPIQRAIDEVLISYVAGKEEDASITTETKEFPLVFKKYNNENDAASVLGTLFFFFPPMILTFIMLYQIVQEKENHLRMGMNLMGLKSSMFWLSWFATAQAYNIILTLLLIIFGAIFQFQYFLNCNFFVNFFLFFEFGTAMIMMGFFLSTLIHRTTIASNAGMGLLIAGFFIQLVLGNEITIYAIFNDDAATWVKAIKWVLIIAFPPFNFSKCFFDIASKTSYVYNPQEDQYVKGPGFTWGDLYKTQTYELFVFNLTIPSTSTVLWYMVLQITIYLALTWYFDNIIGGPNGSAKPFYFFLTARYWGFIPKNSVEDMQNIPLIQQDYLDPDVAQERKRALAVDPNASIAVKIINLHKVYAENPFCATPRDVHALKGLFLTVDKGECFCILGHNGSGKTTLINTLNGLFYPTQGTAKIFGYDIQYDIDELRKQMGVCPQHDILWPELTAREHLEIFAEFKGVPPSAINETVDKLLREVNLLDVGNNAVRTFSGGMKRRMSVAISSIGNPKLIFMDEPTTGLDPVSKRHVWELIQDMKKDRVIFLTTHSLEEADVLSDKIAIMSYGEIKCLGTPLHLKSRFGSGYRINILTDTANVANVKDLIVNSLKDVELVAQNAGNLTYKVPLSRLEQFAAFCSQVEDGKFPDIKDYGVSLTTLEDVFIRVTAESNFKYAMMPGQQVPLQQQPLEHGYQNAPPPQH